MQKLKQWKDQPGRKPLVLFGARQVGKTWLMKEFGRKHFAKTAYINFDNNPRMAELFEKDADIPRILRGLQIEADMTISPTDTLLIFDEIQEVPRALSALKYFNENAPEYVIVAAGSMLGVALHRGTSFPVGKVDFLHLYPMDFMEYLEACGEEKLAELLHTGDMDMVKVFKDTYIDRLRQYYFVGGMPEVVAAFTTRKDYEEVRRIQMRLLTAYVQDISKHAPNEIVPRIRMLWNSIPTQLARDNRKFIYGAVREGARAKDFELAIQWLLDCGLIYKVQRVSKPGMPLMAYVDSSAFKLYLLDLGLLGAMSNLDLRSLLEGNRVFEEFKGSLTEQYVCQQLTASGAITPFYWTAERAIAEVDFVFQLGQDVIPLEVKAEENLKSKSLRQYVEKYKPNRALRLSMSDYREQDWLINLPLYAAGMIPTLFERDSEVQLAEKL